MRSIGIILADTNEYIPFCDYMKKNGALQTERFRRNSLDAEYCGYQITAIQSGVGKVNAATAAADLIFNKKADIILNAGLSGAVSGAVRGDIIAGETYVECDFDITPAGRRLGEKPEQQYIYRANRRLLDIAKSISGIKTGALGTGDFFLTDSSKKSLYRETFGICAFDMESAAIASVCYFTGTPFLSIRKISDNADDTAVADYREIDQKKELDLTQTLLQLIADMNNQFSAV